MACVRMTAEERRACRRAPGWGGEEGPRLEDTPGDRGASLRDWRPGSPVAPTGQLGGGGRRKQLGGRGRQAVPRETPEWLR